MSMMVVFGGLAVALVGLAGFFAGRRDRRGRPSPGQPCDHVPLRLREAARPRPVGGPGTVRQGDARTNQLANELLVIGRRRGFLTMQGKDPRTRGIGTELDRIGGMRRMLDVHDVVGDKLGRLSARELEVAWDGIGSWQG